MAASWLVLNEFWVLVQRHLEPEAWGLHHFIMVPSPEADGFRSEYARPFGWDHRRQGGPWYRKTTVGLFDKPNMEHRLAELRRHVPGLLSAPVPLEIRDYVFYQVTPIEWHPELEIGDESLISRLAVLARRRSPVPLERRVL